MVGQAKVGVALRSGIAPLRHRWMQARGAETEPVDGARILEIRVNEVRRS